MAYEFNGSNQYLRAAGFSLMPQPATIAIWFFKKSTTTKNFTFLGSGSNSFGIYNNGTDLRHYTTAGGTTDFSIGTISANAWTHACAVTESSSSRFGAINGVLSATNTVSRTYTANNALGIGATHTGSAPFDGFLAEVGIWKAALTADEIASLAKGMTCDKVRPQSLVFYAPLVRDLIDQKGGLTITNNNGATVANHPRVYA
jgi:hypothetical protein